MAHVSLLAIVMVGVFDSFFLPMLQSKGAPR